MASSRPPPGSFGRRKAISRAESSASLEILQAAMDVEIAIATKSDPAPPADSSKASQPEVIPTPGRVCVAVTPLTLRTRFSGLFISAHVTWILRPSAGRLGPCCRGHGLRKFHGIE